jgi:hypothetical protein
VGKYGGVPFKTEVMTNNVTRMYGVWKITLRKKGECEYIML